MVADHVSGRRSRPLTTSWEHLALLRGEDEQKRARDALATGDREQPRSEGQETSGP